MYKLTNYENPFSDFDRLVKRYDNLFRAPDMFKYTFDDGFKMMKTDIKETDTAYDITLAIPGFKKEDIKISLNDNVLTVTAERNDEKKEQDKYGKVIMNEIYRGTMSRSFQMDDGTTPEDITAKYEDGMLKLEVAKKPHKEEDVKMISIN